MPDTLPVHVNRGEIHALEVPPSFETDDSFVIEVRNHGEAGRVHVHLDDGLSDVASIDATNHYVRANETHEIPVSVHERGPTRGKIKVVAGYGATTRWIDVELTEPPDEIRDVVVDEELATPPEDSPADTETSSAGSLLRERPGLPVVVLGVVALAVAVLAAVTVRSTVVLAGAAVLVVAVLLAVVLLLR